MWKHLNQIFAGIFKVEVQKQSTLAIILINENFIKKK